MGYFARNTGSEWVRFESSMTFPARREAETQEIVITRHGKPAGVLIGFETEDDWFDYRLENDPRFLRRIARARNSLRAGRGIKLEDFERD